MNAKKVVPLVAAVVLGLLAAFMVVRMIRRNDVATQNGPPVHVVRFVVAADDVPAGQAITNDDLKLQDLASGSPPPGSFDDASVVVGRVASTFVAKGQAVVATLLAPPGSGTGLQAIIPPGMRALTIDVNEVSGVAGYVNAGSRVDIVQTFHDDVSNQPIARCIAQDVEVTAIGTRQMLSTDMAHSVTLLVTPRQAELIELASANGRPRLVLRGTRDQEAQDTAAVTLAELTGTPAMPPPRVADPFAAPTTRPTAPAVAIDKNQWPVRVVSGGEQTLVKVHLSSPDNGTTLTGSQSDQTRDEINH